MEYHSFLQAYIKEIDSLKEEIEFPSPCGVSFILINSFEECLELQDRLFPSPYGVSFILIRPGILLEEDVYQFPSPYGVSFILIGVMDPKLSARLNYLRFPSPYGVSFIFIYPCFTKTSAKREFPSPCGVLFILIIQETTLKQKKKPSFRLLAEYYSFLQLQQLLLKL